MTQKYEATTRSLFCNFCKSVRHAIHHYHALDLMSERTFDSFKVQGFEGAKNVTNGLNQPGYSNSGQYNQQGQGRGMGPGGLGREKGGLFKGKAL